MFDRTVQVDPYELRAVIMICLRHQLEDDETLKILGIRSGGASNGQLASLVRTVLARLGYEEHDLPDLAYLKRFIMEEKQRGGILSDSTRYDCYLSKRNIISSVQRRFDHALEVLNGQAP